VSVTIYIPVERLPNISINNLQAIKHSSFLQYSMCFTSGPGW